MQRIAEAVCHGAVTIVNAMATGKGAALGVNLLTKARVTLTDNPGSVVGLNLTDPTESTQLVETTGEEVLRRHRAHRRFGVLIETQSNIPVAAGLKSSSSVSNAVALATLRAIGAGAEESNVVNLAVDASLKANVTLTGAFDDAMACYSGGLVVTDNFQRRVLKRFRPNPRRSQVIIHVPKGKKYSKDVDRRRLRAIAPVIDAAHREAMKGNYWLSLTLNGAAYSKALSLDDSAAKLALESGAIAAGLSGKGPAVVAIVPPSNTEHVVSAWSSLPGRIIETSINYRKAKATRLAG